MARRMMEEDDWEDDRDEELDSDDVATIECPYCGEEIIEDAVQCPHCENYVSAEDSPRHGQPAWVVWGAILAVVGMIGAVVYGMNLL